MKSDKEIQKIIDRIRKIDINDENIAQESVATLIELNLEIRNLLLKKNNKKHKTDPTKLKHGDILIGEKE